MPYFFQHVQTSDMCQFFGTPKLNNNKIVENIELDHNMIRCLLDQAHRYASEILGCINMTRDLARAYLCKSTDSSWWKKLFGETFSLLSKAGCQIGCQGLE